MMTTSSAPEIQQIVDAIRGRQRFVLSSHARPDGDSIGSQLAMAYALQALGKEVVVVNADPAPGPLMAFPGVPEIVIAPAVKGDFDAAIIMECGDLGQRASHLRSLLRHQHRSSPDTSAARSAGSAGAAACGENGVRPVNALGVADADDCDAHLPRDPHGRRIVSLLEALAADVRHLRVAPGRRGSVLVAQHYDSNNMGRLNLFGAVLSAMQIARPAASRCLSRSRDGARRRGHVQDTEG